MAHFGVHKIMAKCKHEWTIQSNECRNCGYDEYEECYECGEERDIPAKKKVKVKLKKK